MSRVGSQQIEIPENVEVSFSDEVLTVKGPKGELSREIKPEIEVNIDDKVICFQPRYNSRETKALWGTYASHTLNMIKGVTEGFSKRLVIEGVGYRAEEEGDNLVLYVGFSHSVKKEIPRGIEVKVEKGAIVVKGIDKEKVGEFASKIRAVKKPEPYKGKGIRYENEVVRMKEGKKA